jgi:hypothetical protein
MKMDLLRQKARPTSEASSQQDGNVSIVILGNPHLSELKCPQQPQVVPPIQSRPVRAEKFIHRP